MLRKVGENLPKWYPVPVSKLTDYLGWYIQNSTNYSHSYALKRNIAYNLQHLEFMDRCLNDLSISSVIRTQIWKTMIIVGCGIIESILHYVLVTKNEHSVRNWSLKTKLVSNEKIVDGASVKIESHYFEKLSEPQQIEMTFDTMAQKAKAKNLLGTNKKIYRELNSLRPLRNRVHLQSIEHSVDTDWNAFNYADVSKMMKVLYFVITNQSLFEPTGEEKKYFYYMKSY